ncbi:type IV pilus modification protein PilV [Pseudoduganella violacea]|uniref:Type IV pilus assembly protein PilV n=1 Tax=Pseudoduganella violacea TaxID=1715466 RepID=A0A7W5BG30_9BURK|nr:type IV pilus modification protein PilV [Pseudoduganella violacea]MBB3122313.1 type IV pilus assembly protein PilV [Pseudoduganella violacea]
MGTRKMTAAAGFSLLEVLVAMLLLAMGVIGASAMQLHALRTRHESATLSAAMRMAADMADRIRANAASAHLYLELDYESAREGEPQLPARQCRAAACTSGEMARFDAYQFQQLVHDSLPGGRARICRDAATWAAGRPRWECSNAAGAPLVIKLGWRARNPDGTPAQAATDEQPPAAVLVLAGLTL